MRKFGALIVMLLLLFVSCNKNNTQLTTEDKLPPDFMGIKSVTPIDDDSSYDYFMVRWFKARDNLTPGSRITYKVYYKRSETELSPLLAGVVTGETLSYIVKIQRQGSNMELLPTYFFQVEAIDKAGNSTVSKVSKAKARDFHPPKWGYIEEVKELNYHTLKISWSEAEDERTFPAHIRYNIYAGTSKINFSYSHPLTTVTGRTETVIDFDLASYQNSTIYFTVVAEDLSGNKNINGVFREIKVGQVKEYDEGVIRAPVNREFSYDLSSIVQNMSFKVITAPSGSSISGTILSYTPSEAKLYQFILEGLDAEGNIAVITFKLDAYNPPLEYNVPVRIDYAVPPTSPSLYFFSVTQNSLYSIILRERFDVRSLLPEKLFQLSSTPVTFSGYGKYFSFITETSEQFWVSVTDISEGNFSRFNESSHTFSPCPVSTYSTTFTPEAISVNDLGITIGGRGAVAGYDFGFNNLFSIYSENITRPSKKGILRFCENGSVRNIEYFSREITLQSLLFQGNDNSFPLLITKPYEKVAIISISPEIYYSLEETAFTGTEQVAVSSSGQIYLLGRNGKLFYLFGSNWLEIDDDISKLLYLGDGGIAAISQNGIFLLNGLDQPYDILPPECENVLSGAAEELKGVYLEDSTLWLIFPETIYACAR